MNELLANEIIKHRRGALLICLIFVLISSAGLRFLIEAPESGALQIRLSNDYRAFFDGDNP